MWLSLMKICYPLKLLGSFVQRTTFVLAIIYSHFLPYEILGKVKIIVFWISIPEYHVVNTIEYSSEMNAGNSLLEGKVKIQSVP